MLLNTLLILTLSPGIPSNAVLGPRCSYFIFPLSQKTFILILCWSLHSVDRTKLFTTFFPHSLSDERNHLQISITKISAIQADILVMEIFMWLPKYYA